MIDVRRALTIDEQALATVFAAQPDVVVAYLFGSHARGTAHRHSDVDVAVLLAREADADAAFGLRLQLLADLSAILRTPDVDVIVLNDAPLALSMRVVREGRRLFVRDENARVQYEAQVVVRYIDFKPLLERHERAILERARRGELLDGYDPDRGALERYRRMRARFADASEG